MLSRKSSMFAHRIPAKTGLFVVLLAGCAAQRGEPTNDPLSRTAASAANTHYPLEPLSLSTPSALSPGGERGELTTRRTAAQTDDALLHVLRLGVIQSGAHSIGNTSLALRLHLDGGLDAAFKPESKRHQWRYRGEVAAYRLSRLLDLDHVPPSTVRAAKWPVLLAASDAKTRTKLLEGATPRGDGTLSGAMIAWIPAIRPWPIERGSLWDSWGRWLSQEPRRDVDPHASQANLAPQVATLILFDHLSGNRDRWSGNNVFLDVTGMRMIFLDNNMAFDAEIVDVAGKNKRAEVLARVERVPRRLVARFRTLSRAELVTAMAFDDRGEPLLSTAQIDAVLKRRDEAIRHVDHLVEKYGETNVYFADPRNVGRENW